MHGMCHILDDVDQETTWLIVELKLLCETIRLFSLEEIHLKTLQLHVRFLTYQTLEIELALRLSQNQRLEWIYRTECPGL